MDIHDVIIRKRIINEFYRTRRHAQGQARVMHMHYNINVSISLQVQPVAELSELSRRGCDGRQVELAPANIRSGTLRRSGSLRFHQNIVSLLPFPVNLTFNV